MMEDGEAREFATAFHGFLQWVQGEGRIDRRNEVARLVNEFLGEDRCRRSAVTRTLPAFQHVNLQTAINAWASEPDRDVAVHGVMTPPHHGPITLQQILGGEVFMQLRLSAPPLADLPNGPQSTLACLNRALLLVTDERGRYVVHIIGPDEHMPQLIVEVGGLEVDEAQSVHARLAALSNSLNVYRGHVLDVVASPAGGFSVQFAEVPQTVRDDVVLPETVLGRVERHALGVADHREALVRAGQHLKRGLLLYGPPGTGKTHTTRYLVGRMDGYTRLTLTGRALHAVGPIAEMARDLQPAVIVLEDVDLVAEDRSFGPGTSSVLFDLLDAMDGSASDADLLFLLTTNRADLLEPALAARPGRVDVAVEVALPDAEARGRLLALYGRALTLRLSDSETAAIVERSDGVTASFIKELLRRAVLESLHENGDAGAVTGVHVSRALDDLLDSSQQLTRSLLGVGTDPQSLPGGGGVGSLPPGRHGRVQRFVR